MIWNLVIIRSRGGKDALITGVSRKRCIHDVNLGSFSVSINFRLAISSSMLIKFAINPSARSRIYQLDNLGQVKAKFAYLIISKTRPEARHGFLIWILGEQRILPPCLIDILENYEGFTYWLTMVHQNRHLCIYRIILEKGWTLVAGVFKDRLVLDALDLQCPNNPQSIRTGP